MSDSVQGLNVIFTGNGKGKTSAAMGVVFRAMGHGLACRVFQFIKGSMDTGELHMPEKLPQLLQITQVGKGFTWKGDREAHEKAAADGFADAVAELNSGRYGVFVMDEILYALGKELITEEELLKVMAEKPAHTHLILTGRGATQRLIDAADMVSELGEIKHPFTAGIPAQKGLDF